MVNTAIPFRRLSLFYFCYFSILGAFIPYWSLYLKQAGFNADQIGELTALLVATKVIAPNFWGWLADKTGKRLALIRFTTCLSAIFFAGFLYIFDFGWYALVTVVFSLFWNATLPQFEAATLFHLRSVPQRYSRIRLWGSVGFIAAVSGVGWLLDDFSIAYLPYVLMSLLALNFLVALITPEAAGHKIAQVSGGVWQVLARGEVLAFFVVYMLLQVSHGPYYVFYSVYLKQHGYSASLTGQLWGLGVGAEIVLFLVVGRLQCWFSLRNLLLVSLLLTTLRWWMIAYAVDSMLMIVSAQLLHAVSFGLAHVVAIQFLFRYFGDNHQGNGQAFYSSLSFGVGGMLGSLYSGYFWDSLGDSQVFVIASLASGLALLIAFLAVGKNQPKKTLPCA